MEEKEEGKEKRKRGFGEYAGFFVTIAIGAYWIIRSINDSYLSGYRDGLEDSSNNGLNDEEEIEGEL